MKWTSQGFLFCISLLWAFTPTTFTEENEIEEKCDEELYLDPTSKSTLNITSPGYPDKVYTPGVPYTWCLSSPENTIMSIICDEFDIPKSPECKTNALTVLLGGNKKSRSHCGTTAFNVKSSSNKMKVKLHSSKKSRGGKFKCQVKTEDEEEDAISLRAIAYGDNCECGYSYRMRIVGGEETGINEFPFMAGLVDAGRRQARIICGATIISPRHVLTAEHCLTGLPVEQTGVVVGEHNYTTNAETPATKIIRAKRFIHYPYYNSEKNQYDLALIELASPITYSTRVGPVCLPFSSRDWDLTGEYVTVLGWGTTEFGGRRSDALMKVDLQIIDIQNCINSYGSDIDPYTQLCTYSRGKDACQFDSGGPLAWFNPSINRHELVGIVSYGRNCASESPGVNTFVAPFLKYILDQTQGETYCYKTGQN